MSKSQRSYRFVLFTIVAIAISTLAVSANWSNGYMSSLFVSSDAVITASSPIVRTTKTENGQSMFVPLSGTYNIPGDYPDLAAAIADLNAQGVGGAVTLNLVAGNPQTAPLGGYVVGGTGSLILGGGTATSATNTVTIVGNGNTITAPTPQASGALNDGIFKLIGADWITISGFTMLENAANTTTAAATNNMTEWGVALLYVSTTDGAQNDTIQNNTIDLDRTYQNTFGIYSNSTHSATTVTTSASATGAAGGNDNLKVYGNNITDVNNGIVHVGPTAAVDQNVTADIGGASAATGNTVTNFGTTGTFSGYANVSGTVNGILVRNTRNYNVSRNTIASSNGGVTVTGTINGIQVPASSNAPTGTLTQTINNNTISIRGGNVANVLDGINLPSTSVNATTTISINNNDFNTFGHTVAAGTGAINYIIEAGNPLSTSINNNTFTNISVNTTGANTFFTFAQSIISGGSLSISGNQIVTGYTRTGVGSTTVWSSNASSVTGSSHAINGNNFSNFTLTGASAFTGINNTDGASATSGPVKSVSSNTFSNINTGAGTVNPMTVNFSGPNSNVNTNTISGITTASSITCLTLGTSNQATLITNSNLISTITSGGTAVTGISAGAPVASYAKNKIYDLSGTVAGSVVNGIAVVNTTTSSTVTLANNLVGNLTAPAATGANAVIGVNVSGTAATSNFNVFYNTVYVNNTVSGAGFGSSGISALASTTSTTSALNLRNNIIVNTSVPNGAGLTVAYRRSTGTAGTLANYSNTSNNNLFYAGTPGASNLIYSDGTSSAQTLAAYKNGVFTAGTIAPRDSVSITEAPPFLSTTGSSPDFLHINPASPTQAESGAAPVAGITDDFDGNVRNVSTPDIGADEFVGIVLDLTPPAITYTPLANTSLTTDRTLNATITDLSGIASGGNAPRIYYRKNAAAYVSNQCGAPAGSVYPCTINNALIGGVTTADVVDYYVVAQDTAGNVGANPSGGFSAANVNSVTTPPTTPNTYTIAGSVPAAISVGTAQTFTSLTGAGGVFAAINSQVLNQNVTVTITSDLVEDGTNALNQTSEDGVGGYTINFVSDGPLRTISGAVANGMIRLNGADRVTFDGRVAGSGRFLLFRNTNTTNPTFTFLNDATNNTLESCLIEGGNTSATSGTVVFGTSTGTLGNSGNLIHSSFISDRSDAAGVPANAVYSSGSASAPNSTNSITSNLIFNYTGAGTVVTSAGAGNGWTVNLTSYYQTAARTTALIGISVQGGSGHSILSNSIGGTAINAGGPNLVTSNTFRGIDLTVGTASPTSVQGNVIRNIRSTYPAADFASSYGIFLEAGMANIGNIAGNTVGSSNVAERYEVNGDSYGIRAVSTSTVNLSNNTVNNFGTAATPPTGEFYFGVSVEGAGGAHTVVNNTVTNVTNNSTPDASFSTQTIGLIVSATGIQTVRANTVSNIGNTNLVAPAANNNRVWGMLMSGTAVGSVADRNKIDNIYGSSAGVGARADVITCLQSQTVANATFTNNMVSSTGGAASDRSVFGMLDLSAAPAVSNYYFNSVNISGTATAANLTYAFNRNSTATITLRDNSFVNTRSGGTGFHVAMANTNAAATGWSASASDRNILFNVTAANLTQWLGAAAGNNQTLAGFQAASGGDATSLNVDPLFVSASDLHITSLSPARNVGITFGGVTTDFDNEARDGTPDIGADEFIVNADLSITKTDGVTTATPGGSVTYTITASNAGPGAATGATVADTFPASLTATWTCVGAGGGTCTAAGAGNINDSVNLPAGGSVTYTASATISPSATGSLSNTATVAVPVGVTDPTPGNNSATDTDTLVGSADLSITKTDGVTTATPGGSVTYTITASNAGPSNVTGATVADTFPASLTATWTCAGAGGGTCTAAGAGNINDTVNLPSGGSVTYTASATISGAATGTLSNTATVSSATADPVPGNNSATDNDTLTPVADLSITKTDGVTTVNAGGSTTYTITASNAGPSNATGATVADTFPASLTATWTCVGAGGGTCTAAGAGNINDTVNLPAGGSVTYTASTTISGAASGSLSNTATVSAPGGVGDPNPGNNSSTDVDTINSASVGPITVTATAGTVGPTDYPTLKAAIDAINAGTHQGVINVAVVASTTETTSSVLNSSGAGPAIYTSVNIHPVNDGVSVGGPTVTGRGLIELNGADNVTIDGDNPNTAGINRNLTIQNTAVNTVTFTSVIRVALATTIITSADNCTFKNLTLIGSANGRNIAAATATGGTEGTTYGVLATGGASTVSSTTAPTAISSTATTIGAGATANNLTIQNNSVTNAARAVSVQGSATSVFPGLLIENNTIGNATNGAVDGVYLAGISTQGSTNAIVRGNTVYVEGYVATSVRGITQGGVSATGTGTIIEKNVVGRVWTNSTSGFGAYGVVLEGGNTHVVQNNFIYNINGLLNNAAISSTFGPHGIRISSGTGHNVYHNSVNLFGPAIGATSTSLSSAFTITSATLTGINVRNNIFANTMTGAFSSATPVVAIWLPSGATNTMNLTLNNNNYAQGSGAGAAIGQAGTTSGTNVYLAANFNPGATSPASNMRAYTSTLSAAGTNDNASFATATTPPFISNTNLHITPATLTLLESGGAAVGLLTDIDGDTRPNGTAPDIGADEFVGTPFPANDIAATAFVVPTNGGLVSIGSAITPQASFTNVGTATQTNVNVQFTINGPGGFAYTNSQVIASIAPSSSVTVTFAATPTVTTAGSYTMSAAVTTADANAANDVINGSFSAAAALGGIYTVGSGGDFLSLTNPGGIFDAINSLGATSNITVNITSDLLAETGTIALNQVPGGFTVLIQPSGGAARTISGTNTATSLITLNGADGVTFNGLNTGGNSMLIRNTSGTTGAVILLQNDASNNTITNTTIEGGNTNASSGLIFIAAGSVTGNDNNSILTNVIRARTDAVGVPANAVVSLNASTTIRNSNNVMTGNAIANFVNNGFATSAAASSENWTVNNNDFSQNAARAGNTFAINTGGMAGTNTISGNTIHGFTTTGANAALGFLVGNSLNLTISRNRIYDFQTTAGATGVIEGIEYDGASGGTPSLTFINNMITLAPAIATGQSIIGIQDFAFAGNTFTADHNSVYIGGTATGAAPSWAIKRGNLAPTTYTARNNIAFNNRTGGTSSHFAGGDDSANTGTFVSNGNFFAGTGSTAANFMDYGTVATGTPVSFATWQAGPPARDANSFAGVASTFVVANIFVDVSTGNLHILPTAGSIIDGGVAGTGITTDFDNDPRPSGAANDIGADEIVVGDVIPPDTTINSGPPNPSNSNSATFTFSGTDARTKPETIASFECSLDGSPFATCTSPTTLLGLAEGSHTFQVRARDAANNVDPTPASATWVVDTIAPDTTITTNPPLVSASANATFTFTGSDVSGTGIAGFACQLDGGGFAACTSPTNFVGLSNGLHTFDVRATDNAGNTDPTPATFTWTINNTPPSGILYGVSFIFNSLREPEGNLVVPQIYQIDRTNGDLSNFHNLTMAGFTISSAISLSARPTDGTLFAVVETGSGPLARRLVTVNPATGLCTDIGVLTNQSISSISFRLSNSVLYGASVNFGTNPETLFTINTSTAAVTPLFVLVNGTVGDIIAFHPNGKMFHSSGTGTAIFERIDVDTQVVTPLGSAANEAYAMGWSNNPQFLYLSDVASNLFIVNLSNGARVFVGAMADQLPSGGGLFARNRGLAFVQTPTAAPATISGRVLAANGNSIRNARVTLTDSHGVSRTALTSSLGYYSFESVSVGETYILGVEAKRYEFASRVVQVFDSLTEVDIVAEP